MHLSSRLVVHKVALYRCGGAQCSSRQTEKWCIRAHRQIYRGGGRGTMAPRWLEGAPTDRGGACPPPLAQVGSKSIHVQVYFGPSQKPLTLDFETVYKYAVSPKRMNKHCFKGSCFLVDNKSKFSQRLSITKMITHWMRDIQQCKNTHIICIHRLTALALSPWREFNNDAWMLLTVCQRFCELCPMKRIKHCVCVVRHLTATNIPNIGSVGSTVQSLQWWEGWKTHTEVDLRRTNYVTSTADTGGNKTVKISEMWWILIIASTPVLCLNCLKMQLTLYKNNLRRQQVTDNSIWRCLIGNERKVSAVIYYTIANGLVQQYNHDNNTSNENAWAFTHLLRRVF